ncbi:uncharacterized protein TRIVIDRAFT_62713 [Trichoderma virens Gv29-8]|uniref:Uncharacterized protein n=1 Tax=Hypocrea virens (strain Gv29-8 / FGSC 10586) TaxID=413071 RepID=G9MEU5_HYPVG|nr:uncharacterized protein TRIVIDRAFT_62713 [Trichoderma virens Gv29-8]EHK26913.1 hypothetical protein TRIVIDRAFT_62713 [Trichoderma virens Gv29-8]UKZ57367.1 hypothetical protein TrVGV298_011221 [Trichoderma virens]
MSRDHEPSVQGNKTLRFENHAITRPSVRTTTRNILRPAAMDTAKQGNTESKAGPEDWDCDPHRGPNTAMGLYEMKTSAFSRTTRHLIKSTPISRSLLAHAAKDKSNQ